MSAIVGRRALEDAFREIVTVVDTLMTSGVLISKADVPSFSYRLTPKQIAKIERICNEEGWDTPECRGIEINAGTVRHILESRLAQQHVTAQFVGDILAAVYCEFSEVHLNKQHGEQAVFLNGIKKLPLGGAIWHAVAIVALDRIDPEGQKIMASITAYHAGEAKIRHIKQR